MPVPEFSIDGVLPPYIGPDGPGGAPSDMSPYAASCVEVVEALGDTPHRRSILRGWITHRRQLRAIGIERGFQWLDGSFVEKKIPSDLDIVTFFHRPVSAMDNASFAALFLANGNLLRRHLVKASFNLDSFLVDFNGSPEGIVNQTRYLLGLFSHRRGDSLWKGMLQVPLDDVADEADAWTEMEELDAVDAAIADLSAAGVIPVAGDVGGLA
jgi:hypothetical protein